MDLYLLRHGQSQANEQGLVCGSLDYPLSAVGEAQAVEACRRLSGLGFTRVYVSPLQRARRTIETLRLDIPLEVHPELRELNTGDYSLMTFDDLWRKDPRFRTPWKYPALRYPGGETFEEMVQRIGAWFETMSPTWDDDEKVLIAGHEGTLRSIYSRIFGVPLQKYPTFPIGNCDCLHFEWRDRRLLNFLHHSFQAIGGKS